MIKAVRGFVFFAVLIVISVLLIAKGAGALDTSPKVTVTVPAAVNVPGESEPRESGLLLGSNNAVRYEGVIVGRVSNVKTGLVDAEGRQYSEVELQVKRNVLEGIPNDALARIVPRTIFGDNEIHLVAPYETEGSARSTVNLAAGDNLALDTGPEARQLYDVYEKVMRAVYELNIEGSIEGLRQLREGVEGRGEDLGELIVQGADLLESINPLIEGNMIPDAARIATNVESALPSIIGTLQNSADLANLLVAKEDGLRQVFIAGAGFTRDVGNFVGAIGDDTIVILDSGQIVAGALTTGQGTDALLNSIRNVGERLSPGFQTGRLKVNIVATLKEPMPYTNADCPQYPGLASNTCGPAGSAPRPQASTPLDQLVPGLGPLIPQDFGALVPPIAIGPVQVGSPLAELERQLLGPATPAAAQVGDQPSIAAEMLLGPLVRGSVVQVG